MRKLVMMIALALAAGCGSVDDPPLGGPYGGTTGGTDPNSGQNPDQTGGGGGGGGGGGSTDAGTSNTTKDSGSQTTTKDSGSQQTTQDSGSTQTQTAPTWTQVYNSYLAGSTIGRCSGCHSQGSSKGNLYSWLSSKGYISGKSSALVDSNQSCLSWYGGNMPPSGPSSSAAVKDMNAWAAAGALNN